MSSRLAALALAGVALLGAAPARGFVADTPHNLSVTGPGPVRAPGVGELCVFCHTPHRASQTRALWNRDLPPVTYKLYQSSTLEAKPGQPTGASRLCLSCHDGTTALGALRVPPASGRVALGPLAGRAALGTDLSDDHPISFVYDADLARRRGELAVPATVPGALRLDDARQLQCTTCHDPHESRARKFLRVDDRAGALCLACHQPKGWTGSTHATSTATWKGTGVNPWPTTPYPRVADNGCESCHRPHSAPRPPRLLSSAQERQVCLVCHDGRVATRNLEAEFAKASAHPIAATDWTHEPREDPRAMARHVTCADCHHPHQARSGSATPPAASGRLRGVRGVSLGGTTLDEVASEYEVCFKCHGLRDQTTAGPVRQSGTRNVRVKVSPSNPSYHPVAAVGRNPGVTGFEPGYSAASLLYCTDCHNNDEWTAGDARPRGPHGSRHAPILERPYETGDPSSESPQSYALCYKCHNRGALLSGQQGAFPHPAHLQKAKASCAVCHDAHGSRQSPHLIDFMLRDRSGKVVVGPSRNRRRLEYVTPRPGGGGAGSGQCFLECHGVNHEPFSYGG